MSARTDDLQSMIESNRIAVRQLIDGLRDEDLDRTTDVGWKVRSLAGHVAGSPAGNIFVVKRLSAGRNATVPGFMTWALDVRNWLTNRKYKDATRAGLLQRIDDGSRELAAYVATLTDAQLDGRGVVLGQGEQSAEEFLRRLPGHTEEHTASIRNAVGEPVATP